MENIFIILLETWLLVNHSDNQTTENIYNLFSNIKLFIIKHLDGDNIKCYKYFSIKLYLHDAQISMLINYSQNTTPHTITREEGPEGPSRSIAALQLTWKLLEILWNYKQDHSSSRIPIVVLSLCLKLIQVMVE